MVLACGAKSAMRPVTRSSKRAPIDTRQSVLHTAVLVPYEPCIPSIPRHNASEAGTEPKPIKVSVTGMPMPRASWVSSGAAADIQQRLVAFFDRLNRAFDLAWIALQRRLVAAQLDPLGIFESVLGLL